MSKTASLICLIALFSLNALGQYRAAAFSVKRSALMEDIKALKMANPKLTPDEWATAANALLEKEGINTVMSFDAATCEKIKKVRDARKDPTLPIRLNATLKSVDDPTNLSLPEPQFASDDCGGCFIELPVLELTDKDFVTIVAGRNIKFLLPANFYVNTAELIDPLTPGAVKRKWLIPFRSTPLGIMHDEDVIFLGLNDPDLADLTLLVFGEGTFEIGTRKDADEGGLGKVTPPISGSIGGQVKFDRWKNTYTLNYKRPCDAK